jgi:hypothetical protein
MVGGVLEPRNGGEPQTRRLHLQVAIVLAVIREKKSRHTDGRFGVLEARRLRQQLVEALCVGLAGFVNRQQRVHDGRHRQPHRQQRFRSWI